MPSVEPMSAPAEPTAANISAQSQRTWPARAWPTKFKKALTETAKAEVPIPTCGLAIPTT